MKSIRMGSFSILPDHPGIDKNWKIKRRKTKKVDRSIFSRDEDASKQYIKNIDEKIRKEFGKWI